MVADLSPAEVAAASFGLRQSLDTVGAFLGPLAAIVLMASRPTIFGSLFWIAVVRHFWHSA